METAFTLLIGIGLVGYGIFIFIENKIEYEYRDKTGGSINIGSINIDLSQKKDWKKASFTGKWVRPFSVLLSLIGLIVIFKTLS